MITLFASAIGLGAFLLFAIQPQVSKLVLPMLGGTPAVWNTCLVFFQIALLAGYLYAHLIGRLALRVQIALHLALMAGAAIVLPVTIHASAPQAMAERPAVWLFGALIARVAAPFVLAAATAPLLQRWWASTRQGTADDPYFLYVASNAGSLLALLAYPVLIEPNLTLAHQAVVWAVGYALLMTALATAGVMAWRWRATSEAPRPGARAGGVDLSAEPLPWTRRARWFVLSAVPVVIMLGATTHMTTDIAAVPLLWVLPLSVYLLTFILAFARRQILSARWASALLAVTVVPALLTLASATSGWWPLPMVLGAHLGVLFFAALVCHGELARDRPSTAHLTAFYLWIAAGGAFGGLMTALVAPVLFQSTLEYPLGLLAACLLRPAPAPSSRQALRPDLIWAGAILIATVVVARFQSAVPDAWQSALAFAPGLAIVITQWHRPRRFALGLATTFVCGALFAPAPDRALLVRRNFFGNLRVTTVDRGSGADAHRVHLLTHGSTIHGLQATSGDGRREPGSYYGRLGPAGQLLSAAPFRERWQRVGVVGLGVGTLIAQGRPHERWTFFDIDPNIVAVATDRRYFTFLADSPVPHDIVLGEGRLAIAQQPDRAFDLLVLDAFSSDAIPAHLITREAIALYFRKLTDHGVLLVHVSNRFVALPPVLGAIARDSGLTGREQSYVPAASSVDEFASTWVVLARSADALGPVASDSRWRPLADEGRAAWTDDYSSLVAVLKWHR